MFVDHGADRASHRFTQRVSIAAARLGQALDGRHHGIEDEVVDIIASRDTLVKEGARVLGDGVPKIGAHGKPVLFLHPKDFSGALVEIEQA